MISRTKTCLYCKNVFARQGRHSNHAWRDAKYCSVSCRITSKARRIPAKVCESCRQSFVKAPSGVSWQKWETTRFCSKACATAWRNANGGIHFTTGQGLKKPCVGCGKPIKGTIKTLACEKLECKAKGKELRYQKMGHSLARRSRQRGPGELLLQPHLLDRGWVIQYPVTVEGRTFRLDFAKPDGKLYVEADGGVHKLKGSHDAERTRLLIEDGWMGLRFWNSEIRDNLAGVLNDIWS